MYRVMKRDGQIAEFNLEKISNAMIKAFEAKETPYDRNMIDFMALKVTADFVPKSIDGFIQVEDIQDSAVRVLIQAGYADVARAYILYRQQRQKQRQAKTTLLDYKKIVAS